jgi:hypothetical protein
MEAPTVRLHFAAREIATLRSINQYSQFRDSTPASPPSPNFSAAIATIRL